MANSLTNLTAELYNAMDVVSRERIAFLNSVSRDSSNARAAKDQTIRSFVTPVATSAAIVPGQLPPNTGDQTIGNKTITITDCEASPIRWNGEETLGMDTNGPQQNRIFQDQMEQSMRHLLNLVELGVAGLYTESSRSISPSGTTLFDSDVRDSANALQVLIDNGAPLNDLHMVLNTTAGASLRGLEQLTKANEASTDETLRRGILGRLHGFEISESAQIINHTAGTNSGGTTDAAGYAIGATVITLASAGTGTILVGDRVTFAGDTNEYVIASGDSDVSDGGTITLAAPGLRVAMSAATKAITTIADYDANLAFARSAIHLVTRVPAQPSGGAGPRVTK